MLLLSDEQINFARANTFPEIQKRKAIINTVGTMTHIMSSFFIEEDQNINKVFSQKNPKKLKIRFLLIKNIQLAEQLETIDNLNDLNELINKNNITYKDLIADADYKGSRGNKEDLLNENNKYELLYKFNFEIPTSQVTKDSAIAAVCFYEHSEMAIDYDLELQNIDLSLLMGDIYVFSLEVSEEESGNIDLSPLKQLLVTTENILDKSRQQKNIDIKINKKQSYFSDMFHSIDEFGNFNFIFGLDYKQIILNNSSKSEIIKRIDPRYILQTTNIVSFKILRRELEKRGKNEKYILKNKPYKALINTSEENASDKIISADNEDASISDIKLFNNFKTIQVTDKTAYKINPNFYQYGVELTLKDGFFTFVKGRRDTLINNRNILIAYLEDLQNIKNYNYSLERTNSYFSQIEYFRKFYQDNLNTVIRDFITCLSTLNLITSRNLESVKLTLENILEPDSSDIQIVNYLLEIYDRVIEIFNNQLKNYNENLNKINHWFKPVINTKVKSNYGFSYFPKNNRGFLKLSTNFLMSKINNDISSYINGTVQNGTSLSVSPFFVKINGEKTKFSSYDFLKNTYTNLINSIENERYIDMEIEIKKFILNDETPDIVSIEEESNSINPYRRKNSREKAISATPVSIVNQRKPLSDTKNIFDMGIESGFINDDEVNPDILSLMLLRTNMPEIVSQKSSRDIPLQITSLINKTDKIFSTTSANYLLDLEYNSKFLFLYNTICLLEYVDTSAKKISDIKASGWKSLNIREINKLKTNSSVLCRMRIFSNSSLKINFFNQISLPIFDESFILTKSAAPIILNTVNTQTNLATATNNTFLPAQSNQILRPTQNLGQNNQSLQGISVAAGALNESTRPPAIKKTVSKRSEIKTIPFVEEEKESIKGTIRLTDKKMPSSKIVSGSRKRVGAIATVAPKKAKVTLQFQEDIENEDDLVLKSKAAKRLPKAPIPEEDKMAKRGGVKPSARSPRRGGVSPSTRSGTMPGKAAATQPSTKSGVAPSKVASSPPQQYEPSKMVSEPTNPFATPVMIDKK